MTPLNMSTSLMGASLAFCIVYLVRRDHLHAAHALFWLVTATAALVLGLWPGLIDHAAVAMGISYAPALLLLGGLMVVLIKALHADMLNTRLERDLRRLNQRVAMLEMAKPAELLAQDDRG